MNKMHIKTGDEVMVISGKDKGKKGKVIAVNPDERKVIVDKINIMTRHQKARNQKQQGGLVQKESPLYASKVMRVCPRCEKPTRIGRQINPEGKNVRYCKNCKEVIDD
ncbi:MAG: 50S ribosomal protein L24 [Bacillota bacterium]|nr:50S ribosomal protein L24 [Bacillota bacterium]